MNQSKPIEERIKDAVHAVADKHQIEPLLVSRLSWMIAAGWPLDDEFILVAYYNEVSDQFLRIAHEKLESVSDEENEYGAFLLDAITQQRLKACTDGERLLMINSAMKQRQMVRQLHAEALEKAKADIEAVKAKFEETTLKDAIAYYLMASINPIVQDYKALQHNDSSNCWK